MATSPLAQHLPDYSVVSNAYQAFHNDEWPRAIQILQREPNFETCPRYQAMHAEIVWWEAAYTEIPEQVEESLRLVDAAIVFAQQFKADYAVVKVVKSLFKSRQRTDQENSDEMALLRLDCLAVEAELNLFRAGVLLKTGSYVKGALAARAAYNLFVEAKQVLVDDENCQHLGQPRFMGLTEVNGGVDFGYHLFRYSMAILPPTVQWLTSVLGFKGDRLGAWDAMVELSQTDSYRAPFAAQMIAAIEGMQNANHARAIQVIETHVIPKAPEGSSGYFLLGYIKRDSGDVEGSIVAFDFVATKSLIPQLSVNAGRELGRCYLGIGKFAEAEPYFRTFLVKSTANTWRPWCTLQLAVALHGQFKTEEAMEVFASISTLLIEERHSFSTYAARKAAEITRVGRVSPVNWVYFQAFFARDCGQWDRGLELIASVMSEVESSATTDGNKDPREYVALLAYMRGSLHRGAGRLDEAEAEFTTALELAPFCVVELAVAPWSSYELGEVFLKRRQRQRAIDAFTQAQSAPMGYNLDKMLQFKVKRCLDDATKLPA